jgi:hypothetical protein
VRRARAIDPQARLLVRMDSKLVVEQLSGRWKIKHPTMAALAAEVRAELAGADVSFEWVPRLQNSRADALVNLALDAKADVVSAAAGTARSSAPTSATTSAAAVTGALPAELVELLEAEALLRGSGTHRATLESLLHPDFWLVDASGATHTREEALHSLMGSARLPFEPTDAASRELASGLYQLSYALTRGDVVTRRSSLWRRTASGWQLLFHQATPLV